MTQRTRVPRIYNLRLRLEVLTDRSGPAHPTLGSPCWLWTGRIDRGGYGRTGIDKKLALAHRFAYELLVGPIPEGLHLDHLCRVTHCVNPAHLEAVTPEENMRRTRRTHCPLGHVYDEANTYIRPDGWKDCKECINRRSRERNERCRRARAA